MACLYGLEQIDLGSLKCTREEEISPQQILRKVEKLMTKLAKAHPELAMGHGNGSQLVFSYNTNVGPGVDALINNTWAYHPTFIQVDIHENARV